jgi:hypothetical protein
VIKGALVFLAVASLVWAQEPQSSEEVALTPGELLDRGDHEGAIELLRADFDQNPNFIPSGLYLASSAAHAGHAREAARAAAGISAASPDFALSTDFRSHFKNREDREHFVDGLRKAGFS